MQNQTQLQDFLELFTQHLAKQVALNVSQSISQETPKLTEEEHLSTEETKKFLGIKSTTTLNSWVKKGFIPQPKKVGGRKLVYKKTDLKSFLENGL